MWSKVLQQHFSGHFPIMWHVYTIIQPCLCYSFNSSFCYSQPKFSILWNPVFYYTDETHLFLIYNHFQFLLTLKISWNGKNSVFPILVLNIIWRFALLINKKVNNHFLQASQYNNLKMFMNYSLWIWFSYCLKKLNYESKLTNQKQ